MGLEEALRKEGVNVDELDIDLDRKLTPESVEELHQKLLEKQRQKLEQKEDVSKNHPADIEFYKPDSVPPEDAEVFGLDQMWQQFDRIEDEGLRAAESLDKGILLNHTSAQGLYDDICRHFLEFADEEISDKRKGKLELAEAVMNDGQLDIDQALRWFDERDSVQFDRFNAELFRDDRDLDLGKNEKVYEQTIDEYWEELKNRKLPQRELLKRGTVLDIAKTLEGLAHHRDDDFRQQLDRYSDILEKFRPEVYSDHMDEDSEYMIYPVFGRRRMTALSDTVGTCMTRFDSGEKTVDSNVYSEAPLMHQDDPFTFVHAIGREDELRGYVRSYIMEDSDGKNFLAIDTVEVPEMRGMVDEIEEDMQGNSDIISAGVLGAMKVGLDLGVDYIAGKDARIKYGPRPGYSNTSKEIAHEKPGEPVPFYAVGETTRAEEVERCLPEHGEVSWEAEYSKKVPWFSAYCHDQETRGFDTMPGETETEAKILMEFP